MPSSANTIATITTVQPTTIPQSIDCKNNYSGTPKYTCINGTFALDIASGSCNLNGCLVPTCVTETFIGYGSNNLTSCINFVSKIGATRNFDERGWLSYYQQSNGISYNVKWRCNFNGTMDIDIEATCHHLNLGTMDCLDRNHNEYCAGGQPNSSVGGSGSGYYYCCNGMLKITGAPGKNPCPWYWGH